MSDRNPETPVFGRLEPGAVYRSRRGGYAVVLGPDGRVATVLARGHFHLPGGGREPGESASAAAVREALEEAGLEIEIVRPLGVAHELGFSVAENTHYRKEGEFFLARAPLPSRPGVEPDHELRWLAPADAARRLVHGSHRWALARAVEL